MTRALLERCLYVLTHRIAVPASLVTELRAHLAHPQGEPEPVAYRYRSGRNGLIEWVTTTIYANAQAAGDYEPLFTHPAHTEAEVQEILACIEPHLIAFSEPVVRRILGVPA